MPAEKYTKIILQEKERQQNWQQILARMTELNLTSVNQNIIKKQIQQKEGEHLRYQRQKLSAKDYEPLAIIGRGAFGEGTPKCTIPSIYSYLLLLMIIYLT